MTDIEMIDMEAFMPHIMPSAPGCALPTAYNAIRQACMSFCEATRAWRCEDEFDVTPGSCAFVCAPDGAELFEIEAVDFNGSPLDAISIAVLDRDHPGWRQRTDNGSPRYYTQLAFDTLQIVPRGTGRVKVHGFFKPSEEADVVPALLFKKFARVIASGALADILLLPGQPFFSPDLSSVHAARFQSAKDRNSDLNVRGQQRAPVRTRSQFL